MFIQFIILSPITLFLFTIRYYYNGYNMGCTRIVRHSHVIVYYYIVIDDAIFIRQNIAMGDESIP